MFQKTKNIPWLGLHHNKDNSPTLVYVGAIKFITESGKGCIIALDSSGPGQMTSLEIRESLDEILLQLEKIG